ncbi:unnamed protein product [Ectocarpus sp. CCAP 1310/34]|nr:unnamed protein product [Ectocarpus sp. CCAP 1310/34]
METVAECSAPVATVGASGAAWRSWSAAAADEGAKRTTTGIPTSGSPEAAAAAGPSMDEAFQGQRVYAERGQPVVPQMRSTSRENCTIVTTINAAGAVLAPTIIFKGQRFNEDWIVDQDGPPGATYTCTESSFMCGDVFIKYIIDFHEQLRKRNLLDGKFHVLMLDGHASHVSLEIVELARSLNIHLVQLPSHMSHITQPLDVAGFGCFKNELTKAIQAFLATHGGALPRKRDMASVIGQAWSTSFTPDINKASFAGAGLWPVDKERALSRLLKPKRKERETDRPPLQDVPIAVSNDRLEELLGERAVRKLLGEGHTLTGLRVSTVFLGDYLPSKRSKKPPTRANLGILAGGLLTCDGWLAEMKKKQNEVNPHADTCSGCLGFFGEVGVVLLCRQPHGIGLKLALNGLKFVCGTDFELLSVQYGSRGCFR